MAHEDANRSGLKEVNKVLIERLTTVRIQYATEHREICQTLLLVSVLWEMALYCDIIALIQNVKLVVLDLILLLLY